MAGECCGPEVLEIVEVEVREPDPGEMRVTVEAAGVNVKDTCQRTGVFAEVPPVVLGLEGAGTVEVLGRGRHRARRGQRVAWVDDPGGCAGKVVLRAERAVLDSRIGVRRPLAEAAGARTDLAARRTTGKLLLIP
ncbi:alcohol dehydrogenase catalytic domain-containing protein [Streptomyces sp. CLV115]|uniref:alcohol dehydrogenase catalytic domain-containing protein n=1 Tax=Streptomyces sp. CLV115 TaxID=3138502 RepID=UPI00313D218A